MGESYKNAELEKLCNDIGINQSYTLPSRLAAFVRLLAEIQEESRKGGFFFGGGDPFIVIVFIISHHGSFFFHFLLFMKGFLELF